MPSYLVEAYTALTAVEDARNRAALAAQLGKEVRYVRTTFLPDDETVLHLFEAPSVEALRSAGRRAALQYERIIEAVEGSSNAGSGLAEPQCTSDARAARTAEPEVEGAPR